MLISFCANEVGIVHQQLKRFCKNESDSSLESLTVTRVESFCEKRDPSRVTIFLNVTRVWVTKNRDSSRVIVSSHAITGFRCSFL